MGPWQPLWLPSLKPRQRLQPSHITDMVDTEATVGMEAMGDTDLEDTGDTTASERPRLSPTMAMEVMEATVVDTEAMADTVTGGATTASVRPMPHLRLLLSLITDTADTEATVEDMEAMVVMVLGTAGATTASVRLRLSPTMATEDTVEDTEDMEATGATVATMVATTASVRPRLSPTMAMAVMEDMVDTVEVMEATEVTVMATASNMFPNSSNEYFFAQP